MAGATPPKRDRADKMLVALGLFDSRASARAAIEAGGVTVDGIPLAKPSQVIAEDAAIIAQAAHPYVSRGGLKLAYALDSFSVDPAGRRCLDIGASTGGFTDVLLRRGAAFVVSVDVGQGQLRPHLAIDPRVKSLEATDARNLDADLLGGAPDLVVCDASFIALEKLLAVPLALSTRTADLVALFKPQFQVGRDHVGKGGIVSNMEASKTAANGLETWLADQGWAMKAWTDSPIRGGDGNAERLFHAARV